MTNRPPYSADATPRTLVSRSALRLRRTATRRRIAARVLWVLTFGIAKPTTLVDMRVAKSGRLEVLAVTPDSFADMPPVRRYVTLAIMTAWAVSLGVGAAVVVKWIATGEAW